METSSRWIGAALFAVTGTLGPALAQLPDPDASVSGQLQIFVPTDFEQYAPRTALDMVGQIDGFRIDDGDTDQRGLGEASGNVLINGRRVASKTSTPSDVLGRIAAASVQRIEVLDGASLDVPGLAGVVVNVIAETSEFNGTWFYRARFRDGLQPSLDDIDIVMSGRQGDLSWALEVATDPFPRFSEGEETVFDALGQLQETRREDTIREQYDPEIAGSLTWDRPSGDELNLEFTYLRPELDVRERSARTPVTGPDETRLLIEAVDTTEIALTADYARDLGPGRLKLIALASQSDSKDVSQTLTVEAADPPAQSSSLFEQEEESGEFITRAEYALSTEHGHDWQASFEGAFNFLDSAGQLFLPDAGGTLVPESVDNAASLVEERRAEAFLTHGRSLSGTLNLQVGVGVEYSELTQSGGIAQTREFVRPKGFAALSWDVTDSVLLSARIEREVGQLDFGDFVSSVDLDNDFVDGGNPDLVPEQSWSGELDLEWTQSDFATYGLILTAELIEDVVDQVPISDTLSGPGNLDRAERYTANAEATFKLDRFGIPGGELDLEWIVGTSSIDDPLSGEPRQLSDQQLSEFDITFRHDIPGTDWAYGLSYDEEREAARVRLDEIRRDRRDVGNAFAFVEHKDLFGAVVRFEVFNILDWEDERDSLRFVDRRDGLLDRRELRLRRPGNVFIFEVERSF